MFGDSRAEKWLLSFVFTAPVLLLAISRPVNAEETGTAITYQGLLKLDGAPYNGDADFAVQAFDDLENQVGPTLFIDAVTVVDGVFTMELDFGLGVFDGSQRYLYFSVRTPSNPGAGNYNGIPPAQPITGAPFSQATRGIFVDADGNVGLKGAYDPQFSLIVPGTIRSTALRIADRLQSNNASLILSGTTNGVRVLMDEDDNSADAFQIFDGGVERFRVIGDTGHVGIGTTATPSPLSFAGTLGDKIALWQFGGQRYGFGVQAFLLQIFAGNVDADIAFGYGTSENFVENMRVKGNGNVGIGTSAPLSKLDVRGDVSVRSTIESTLGDLVVSGAGWGVTVEMDTDDNSANAFRILDGGAEVFRVEGNTGETFTKILTITGGSDIAEPYNINSAAPEPGMVVSIDPTRVGELCISNTEYDTKVAGIISGANGVKTGLTLTQQGSIADGTYPVAMTGRVWTWCDADAGGPIAAGDLLTTSKTAGHAMKAADHARAGGATIGKAMSALESGRSMVLVLVNLQ